MEIKESMDKSLETSVSETSPNVSADSSSIKTRLWNFLKVRKIWWITPLIILLLLFLISVFAGDGLSVGNVYAPI